MIHVFFAALLGTVIGGEPLTPSGSPTVQTVCFPDVQTHRSLVQGFLTRPAHEDRRARSGMADVDPSTLRVLSDDRDAEACRRLREMIQPGGAIGPAAWPYVFYSVGGKYIAIAADVPPPGYLSLGFSSLVVLDSSLNVVASFLF